MPAFFELKNRQDVLTFVVAEPVVCFCFVLVL